MLSIQLFIVVGLRTNSQQVVVIVGCSASSSSCRFSCSVQREWSGKLQGKDLCYLLTVWSWPANRDWSSFFAECTHWPNILQQSLLNDVYSDPNPPCIYGSLYHSLSLSLSLYCFLSKYFSEYLLASLSLSSLRIRLSLLLARLLQSSYRKEA